MLASWLMVEGFFLPGAAGAPLRLLTSIDLIILDLLIALSFGFGKGIHPLKRVQTKSCVLYLPVFFWNLEGSDGHCCFGLSFFSDGD